MQEQQYSFHHRAIKYTIGFLISFAGGIILFLLVTSILVTQNKEDWVVYTSIPISVAMFGGVIYYAIKSYLSGTQGAEKIIISDKGLYTKTHGEIPFDSIAAYKVKAGLSLLNVDKPAPSLIIRLKDQRKIRYDLNIKYYQQEIDDYLAFIDAFVNAMPSVEQKNQTDDSVPIAAKENTQTTAQYDTKPSKDHEEAQQNLQTARKRKRRAPKFALSVSFVFVLLGVAYFYRTDIMDHFRSTPVHDVITRSQKRVKEQSKTLQEEMAKEGAVYLFTNDTTAQTQLYPSFEDDSPYQEHSDVLQKLEMEDKIEHFLQHKDSLRYFPALVLKDTILLQESSLPVDATSKDEKKLYFTVYDSEDALADNGGSRMDNAHNIIMTWTVSYENIEQLEENILGSLPNLKQLRSLFGEMPGYFLYVTATEREKMTKTDFKKAMQTVCNILDNDEIDFTIKTFSGDGNSP